MTRWATISIHKLRWCTHGFFFVSHIIVIHRLFLAQTKPKKGEQHYRNVHFKHYQKANGEVRVFVYRSKKSLWAAFGLSQRCFPMPDEQGSFPYFFKMSVEAALLKGGEIFPRQSWRQDASLLQLSCSVCTRRWSWTRYFFLAFYLRTRLYIKVVVVQVQSRIRRPFVWLSFRSLSDNAPNPHPFEIEADQFRVLENWDLWLDHRAMLFLH